MASAFRAVVYDGKGGLMRLSLSKDQKYRIRTRLSDIPPAAVDSVLRYEDRYYWQHPGVNVLALAPRRIWSVGRPTHYGRIHQHHAG